MRREALDPYAHLLPRVRTGDGFSVSSLNARPPPWVASTPRLVNAFTPEERREALRCFEKTFANRSSGNLEGDELLYSYRPSYETLARHADHPYELMAEELPPPPAGEPPPVPTPRVGPPPLRKRPVYNEPCHPVLRSVFRKFELDRSDRRRHLKLIMAVVGYTMDLKEAMDLRSEQRRAQDGLQQRVDGIDPRSTANPPPPRPESLALNQAPQASSDMINLRDFIPACSPRIATDLFRWGFHEASVPSPVKLRSEFINPWQLTAYNDLMLTRYPSISSEAGYHGQWLVHYGLLQQEYVSVLCTALQAGPTPYVPELGDLDRIGLGWWIGDVTRLANEQITIGMILQKQKYFSQVSRGDYMMFKRTGLFRCHQLHPMREAALQFIKSTLKSRVSPEFCFDFVNIKGVSHTIDAAQRFRTFETSSAIGAFARDGHMQFNGRPITINERTGVYVAAGPPDTALNLLANVSSVQHHLARAQIDHDILPGQRYDRQRDYEDRQAKEAEDPAAKAAIPIEIEIDPADILLPRQEETPP
jgi:hypothetical protein